MKPILSIILITVLFVGLVSVESLQLSAAQVSTPVSGIINTNTTWTKANSPYTLTGPVAVNVGVTLTIEGGATINLNSFYIQVNGTLIARGFSTIQIGSGTLRFTSVSIGWNDQVGTGCIIEYTSLTNVSILASNALKLNQDSISGNGSISVGTSSIITNNNIQTSITAGDSTTVSNNEISLDVNAGVKCTFSNNKIKGSISAGDQSTVTGNTVGGGVVCAGNLSLISNNNIGGQVNGGVISNNTISSKGSFNVVGTDVSNNVITGGTVTASSKITNNVIVSGNYTGSFRVFGGYAEPTENKPAITGTSSESTVISGNTITGGGTYTSYGIFTGPFIDLVPAIDGGAAKIFNNVVTGRSGLAISGSSDSIYNNTLTGDVSGSAFTIFNNTVYGSINLGGSNTTISNNIVNASITVNSKSWNIMGNAAKGITTNQGNGVISDNSVMNGKGININGGGTIERNYVLNNTVGITVTNSTASILNNTIASNGIGIVLHPPILAAVIRYNNIQLNGQSIFLELGVSNDVEAAYNWWGTTNQQVINQSIYDFKNDFNLGTVNFTPILTATNPQAVPNPNSPTPTPSPSPTPTPTPPTTNSPSPNPTSPAPTPTPTQTESPAPNSTPSPTIPEFPPFLAAGLIMIPTIAGTLLYKKKPAKKQ